MSCKRDFDEGIETKGLKLQVSWRQPNFQEKLLVRSYRKFARQGWIDRQFVGPLGNTESGSADPLTVRCRR